MDEQTRKRIDRVVLDCEVYWLLHKIPRPQVEAMKTELEQHLYEAAADGKLVEDVVGDDVQVFADEWAKAVTAKPSPAAKVKDGLYVLLVSASVVIPFKHLSQRAGTVWLSWADFASIAAISLAIRLLLSPLILVSGKRRTWRRRLSVAALLIAVAAVPVIPVYYAATHREAGGILQWPWYASLVLAAVTWIYSRWVLRTDATAPVKTAEESRKQRRADLRLVFVYTAVLIAVGWWWWRTTGVAFHLAGGVMVIVGILWWTKLLTVSRRT